MQRAVGQVAEVDLSTLPGATIQALGANRLDGGENLRCSHDDCPFARWQVSEWGVVAPGNSAVCCLGTVAGLGGVCAEHATFRARAFSAWDRRSCSVSRAQHGPAVPGASARSSISPVARRPHFLQRCQVIRTSPRRPLRQVATASPVILQAREFLRELPEGLSPSVAPPAICLQAGVFHPTSRRSRGRPFSA